MDGTPQSNLGANSILSVSMAESARPPPTRGCRSIATSGARWPRAAVADDEHPERRRQRSNNVDAQEFDGVPVGAENLREGLRWRRGVSMKSVMAKQGLSTAVGDEGGLRPDAAVQRGGARSHHDGNRRHAGYEPGKDVAIALDPRRERVSTNDGMTYSRRSDKFPPLGRGT